MRILSDRLLPRRLLGVAGFAVFAGLGLAALPGPAAAAGPDMREACKYSAAPQGYGESMRYTNCMHQLECIEMANRAGHTIYTAGCFGVAPQQPAAAPAPRH